MRDSGAKPPEKAAARLALVPDPDTWSSRGLARATAVLAGAHAVQVAASLANLELLTRALSPAKYGDYAAVVAAYVVLGALTDLGTGLVAVRSMARAPERARETLVATIRLRLLLAFAASAAGVLASGGRGAGLAGALLPPIQAWGSTRLLLQATLAEKKLARAQILGRLLQVALVALALRLRPDPLGAVLALAAGELVSAALLRLEAGALPSVPWRESLAEAKLLAVAALPLAGAFLANELAGQLDVLWLAAARTSEETGLYALAARPLQVLEPLPRLLLWSVFPILSRSSARGDLPAIALLHRRATLALALAALVLAVSATLLGPALLAALFDPRYREAAGPLVILAWGGALSFVAAPAESTLVALDRTRRNLLASLGALGVNVAANALLIPRLGATGAAWAWLATSAAQLVLLQGLAASALRGDETTTRALQGRASGCR
jgi:O-antigen/teichoic acid export membrane protein